MAAAQGRKKTQRDTPALFGGAELKFFSPVEAGTFEAIAARIWPGTPRDPGAREVGAVYYLDRAMAGPYADLQLAYREGLAAINEASRVRYDVPFLNLHEAQQDELLTEMEQNRLTGFPGLSAAEFFNLCLVHTMEGVFSDPLHGGNVGFEGWKAVGYPGPQYAYTAEEQTRFEPLEKPLRGVSDLAG